MKKRTIAAGIMGGLVSAGAAAPAMAAIDGETGFILNSFSFLLHGALVMWMAAGFCMLEAGMVRSKNVATMCTKNIALYSIAGIMFWFTGYNLMYSNVDGGWIGQFGWFAGDDSSALNAGEPNYDAGYAATSDWFFQMVFVATAVSIVSGTLAERIKVWPFLIFAALLSACIYPIQGAWHWGAGWLSALETPFVDFAGSTVVHSTGGWAALAGAIILGARRGKYSKNGRVNPMPGSSLPLATLGTFILWMGWFGFNGGSQLAINSAADIVATANIYANTNLAAAGGVVAALILNQILYKNMDLTMMLNGALAGLVSITAGPDTPTMGQAILIGAVGGALVVITVPLLDRVKIDDVVGAIPVHLVAGIWGTLAVPLTNDAASIFSQLTGIVAIGLFVFIVSAVIWFALRLIMGIRLDEEDEQQGADWAEIGLQAYPEFHAGGSRL